MKIAILGAGAYGTALGGILANNGHSVVYYDPKLEKTSLDETLSDAKMIVLCIPSNSVPHMLKYLPKKVPLVCASKGILSDEMFSEFKDFMVLSGAGFADDIKAGKKTELTATDSRIMDLFKADFIKYDLTRDVKGVLMCGALKNVYAFLAGLSNLKRGTALHKLFIDEAAMEMGEVLAANGADKDTVKLACGRKDLELSCGLPSRNYEFGHIIRENPKAKAEKTVEGISAINRIKRGEIVVPSYAVKLKELLLRSREWS